MSLVPSITETLLAWGVVPVAVTRFCEAPGIPAVGGTKNPDVATIEAMAPDVVLMDEQENRREDAEALAAAGLRVVATDVRAVDEVGDALARLAEAVGVEPSKAALSGVGAGPLTDSCRVFVPIWKRPWMTVSGATYGSSLLELCGLENVFAGAADPYPEVDIDGVLALRPSLVLAPSEPYPFAERHRAMLEEIAPTVFVDGRDLFWWGIRTPAASKRLRELAARIAGG